MDSPFSLAIRIWFAALLTNTILIGLFALSFAPPPAALGITAYSFIAAGVLTVPVFLGVWVSIKTCKAMHFSGPRSFITVMLAGLSLTMILCLLMLYWINFFGKEAQTMCAIAIISAITGVSVYVYPLTNTSASETAAAETTVSEPAASETTNSISHEN